MIHYKESQMPTAKVDLTEAKKALLDCLAKDGMTEEKVAVFFENAAKLEALDDAQRKSIIEQLTSLDSKVHSERTEALKKVQLKHKVERGPEWAAYNDASSLLDKFNALTILLADLTHGYKELVATHGAKASEVLAHQNEAEAVLKGFNDTQAGMFMGANAQTVPTSTGLKSAKEAFKVFKTDNAAIIKHVELLKARVALEDLCLSATAAFKANTEKPDDEQMNSVDLFKGVCKNFADKLPEQIKKSVTVDQCMISLSFNDEGVVTAEPMEMIDAVFKELTAILSPYTHEEKKLEAKEAAKGWAASLGSPGTNS